MTGPRVDFEFPPQRVFRPKGMGLDQFKQFLQQQGFDAVHENTAILDFITEVFRSHNLEPQGTNTFVQLMNSGLLDTLQQLSGGDKNRTPISYDPMGGAEGSWQGLYSDKKKTIRLSPSETTPDAPEQAITGKANIRDQSGFVLAHEFGHKMDQQWQYPNAWFQIYGGKAKPNSYASTNYGEHFAEAYATAITITRAFAKMPGNNKNFEKAIKGVMEANEENVPGTMGMVAYLMNQPTYKDYPNRKMFQKLGQARYEADYEAKMAAIDSARKANRNKK